MRRVGKKVLGSQSCVLQGFFYAKIFGALLVFFFFFGTISSSLQHFLCVVVLLLVLWLHSICFSIRACKGALGFVRCFVFLCIVWFFSSANFHEFWSTCNNSSSSSAYSCPILLLRNSLKWGAFVVVLVTKLVVLLQSFKEKLRNSTHCLFVCFCFFLASSRRFESRYSLLSQKLRYSTHLLLC